jgi:Tfp pilus assembly major pilin PilA
MHLLFALASLAALLFAIFAFFSFVHVVVALAIVALVAFIALSYYAYKEREDLQQATDSLIGDVKSGLKQLDADLLAKVHALENGGHLAAGTTQNLVDAQAAALKSTATTVAAAATA